MFFRATPFFLCVLFSVHCSLFRSAAKIKPLEFNYSSIAVNYFTPENDKPFPLTVQRGNNLYNSTTADGRYLFYTTGQKGNYDIWFRDLQSSITVPVTEHPAAEFKPAISPDGKKLVFVSEQYDSAGDLVLLDMDPKLWSEKILEGKRFLNSDFIILTNPNFEDSGKKDGYTDTDPFFAPDGRRLVFSSDRLSPGIQNLVILDTEGKDAPKLLTKKGGASPVWSADGKSIVYISYRDGSTGDVYLLDLASGKEDRLTSDSYLNFSPSLSADNRYLYYTSIRGDSNSNGRLDERDNSLIVRKDLKTGTVRLLTSGNDSLFDSRFSAFNGGSVLFTAAYYNTLNIYFIPASGSVSKEKDIISQYELALKYRDKQSFEDFLLALDAIEFYFAEDPIYPLIKSKALILKYKEAKNSGRNGVAEAAKKEIFAGKFHPAFGLGYGLFLVEERKNSPVSAVGELRKYSQQMRSVSGVDADLLASLLEEEADLLARTSGDRKQALKLYEEILNQFPKFYKIRDIYRKSGDLQYKDARSNSYSVPETFVRIAEDPQAGKEDLRLLYERIDREIVDGKAFSERIDAAEISISSNALATRSPRLLRYFLFVKALGLNGKGGFEESNSLIDSFLSAVPESDPLFLKSHLLKSNNFKGLGEVQKSFDELRIYLEKYDPLLGVDLEEKDIERSFIYFENKARDHDRRGNLQDAAFHYFFNTENMFLVKSRNLFLETLYKEYAVYYQRMMVDSVFKLSGFLSEEKRKALLGKIDIIDLRNVDPLAEEGLTYINQYYKIAVPRSRPVLDLATLYGYSYYLVNRSVIRESYYNAADSMTAARKEEILRDFKQAEYELRWIIFADPRYYEAYQLLGWMYQYIDILKSRKSGEDQPSDEEKYSGVYKKYFPEKNFEENIELYSQVLELLGESFENKKALSDLRLNLGNNYFLLKNYPRANEQYSKVDSLSDFIISKTQFENYRQKAMFLFNSARSSIYVADYKSAVVKLKSAARLYFENEAKRTVVGRDSAEKLQQYKLKLALIFTLTGLSHMESGEFQNAILYYKDALSLNGENGWIDPVNLHNGLALCYQKLGKYKLSESHLVEAERIYSGRGGVNWIPKGVKLTFWDYFWDFVWDVAVPDGVRISGEGRFPEAISPKFQPLMTTGIRVNNMIQSLETEGALRQIEERLTYVDAKGLSSTLAGSLIQSNSYNDLGYINFKREDFRSAVGFYEDAQKLEKDKGFVSKARSSFKRGLYSYFAYLEHTKEEPAKEIKTLNETLERLNDHKNDFISSCSGEKIPEEEIHSEFKRCNLRFYNLFPDHDPLLSLVYYYLGRQYMRSGDRFSAFEFFGLAAGLLENPSSVPRELVGLSGDPYSRKERIFHSIGRASLYVLLGDDERAKLVLDGLAESTNEFYYIQELIEALVLYAEIFLKDGNFSKAREKVEKASSLLLSHPHLIGELKSFVIRKLYKIGAESAFETGKRSEGFRNLDKLRKIRLFRQFARISHESEEGGFSDDTLKLQNILKKQKSAYVSIQAALENRQKFEVPLRDYQSFVRDFEKHLADMKSKNPDLEGYLGIYSDEPPPAAFLKQGEGYLRLESSGFKTRMYRTTDSKEEFVEEALPVQEFLKKNAETVKAPYSSVKSWFVQIGEGIDLKKINSVLPTRRSFVSRVSHLKQPQRKDLRVLQSSALVEGSPNNGSTIKVRRIAPNEILSRVLDTDLLISPLPDVKGDNPFGESFSQRDVALKELLHQRNEFSAAVFYSDVFPDAETVSDLYELLNAAGIGKAVLCVSSSECSKRSPESLFENEISEGLLLGSAVLRIRDRSRSIPRFDTEPRNEERKERIRNAYSSAYTLRSAQSFTDPIRSGETELLRLKWKLSSSASLKEIYGKALSDAKSDSEKEDLLVSALLTCYLEKKPEDCENVSEREITDPKKKDRIGTLKKFRTGFSPRPSEFETADSRVDPYYDPYLYYKNILKIARDLYEPEIGEFAAKKALREAKDSEEVKAVEEILQGLYAQRYFLEGTSLNKNQIKRKDELYLVLSGNWKEALEVLRKREEEEDTGRFRERMFQNWKREITGAWFSPYSLYSEVYGNSPKLFESLDPEERSLLFHLILYSVPFQSGEESDLLAEALVDFEWASGAKNRVLRMVLEYAQALFTRGETDKCKIWLGKMPSKYAIGPDYEEVFKDYNILMQKIAFSEGKVLGSSFVPLGSWVSYYEKARSKSPSEFVELLNDTVRSKRGIQFSSTERAELFDFISYLQSLSFRKNNSETFFDLAFAKDLLSTVRPILLNRTPDFKDLPEFESVSERLKEKLPKDQEFLAVMDLGTESYYIRFTKGKSKGDLAIKDNRKFRAALYQYLEETSRGGYEVLLREELENEYRKNIRLSKNRLTYLYLSSYHFRVPIVPRTEDRFYIVTDPAALLSNPFFASKEEFYPEYQIQFLSETKSASGWQKTLKELEKFEAGSGRIGSDARSKLYVLQDPLEIVNQVSLTLAGKSVFDYRSEVKKGNWIYTSSYLEENRYDIENYRDVFYRIGKGFVGPGIVFIGEQSDTVHVEFVKRFSKRSTTRVPLYIRFQETLDAIKESHPLDRLWNGYRMYTNSLIEEEVP
ncbi:biopolymer transporter TolR [Leptospira gomenensis]|uniref:Biopolymer transporter TolR n=1 Tax=Leptospira gomenensis TaxID=2484974 RepID=A0A5F1YE40_9LEPT|nr:PD40 domain-containing protein [Leptospira gomenensis]TGK36405.1 biopolymer transporter TolR [Leptospira gomenensis]TGK41925.1 biopolymer transporter TolR [Leptospira gomenensis]TGK49533.1 biopolymer transporter TolR [Leptospira gomenensis]TGK67583.1 biopolymer transporter TolR [Leptospira gomenensis]